MGDQDQGGVAITIDVEQQLGNVLAGVAIEIAGGFVGKQDDRVAGKCPGNGNSLLLASGHLARVVIQSVTQAEPGQVPGQLVRGGDPGRGNFQGQQHVFQGRQAGANRWKD